MLSVGCVFWVEEEVGDDDGLVCFVVWGTEVDMGVVVFVFEFHVLEFEASAGCGGCEYCVYVFGVSYEAG